MAVDARRGTNGNIEHLHGDVLGWIGITSASLALLILSRDRTDGSGTRRLQGEKR